MRRRLGAIAVAGLLALGTGAQASDVTIDTSSRRQVIDGFGTCVSGSEGAQPWFRQLYFDELRASILRIDLTPPFAAPASDHLYNSPWFGNTPDITGGGPEGNYVRTYTGVADYTRLFGGQRATIAVMGPDIDANVQLIDYTKVSVAGGLAQLGQSRSAELGGFKLYGSMWSPAPWLKISSGQTYPGGAFPLPSAGTAWPFVWGGNFAGGLLDTSDTPRAEFNNTSALVQFARGLAAYLRGFQNTYGVRFYAISIQNEVNFEEFYNSCSYPLSSQYIKALKAARTELDKYDDLRGILIAGPEDLLGGSAYGLWQYGAGSNITHKNLQYLQNIAADAAAASALSFFNIHGYDSDGASSAGANPQYWDWWANGWTTAPAAGLPASAAGFTSYGKKSWMTETSGEQTAWLAPSSGFPGDGAWSIALKIHQALTTGRESAWLYWQLSDGKPLAAQTLSDSTALATSPKLVAAKHFFRFIRPGAQAVATTVTGTNPVLASAYLHEGAGTLTIVLINAAATATTATVAVPSTPSGIASFESFTSSNGNLWSAGTLAVSSGQVVVPIPAYGVVTLSGQGTRPDGGVSDAGTSGDAGADGGPGEDGGTAPDGGEQADGGVDPAGGVVGKCGCAGAPGPGFLLVLAALGLALRRRGR